MRRPLSSLNSFQPASVEQYHVPLMPLNQQSLETTTCPEELFCTSSEVLSYIQKLDPGKASGPDVCRAEC